MKRFNKTTLKICLGILCLLPVLAVGSPQSIGATFFMKEIILTGGLICKVDDEDYEHLNKWKWQKKPHKNDLFYAVRTVYKSGKRVPLKMHRYLMGVTDPNILVDHRDHDGLNNQKSNLRTCNKSQNNVNRVSKPNSTSKYMGVHYKKGRNRWVAGTSQFNKHIHIGNFKTEEEAALAYNKVAFDIHGEFANLNIIE